MSQMINELEASSPDQHRSTYYNLVKQNLYLAFLASFLLIFLLVYTMTYKEKVDYYATTTSGVVVPMSPLSEPVVTDEFVARWASIAARDAYNIDFVNYKKSLEHSKVNFSKEGWVSFRKALDDSMLLDQVLTNKLRVTAVITRSPVVVKKYIKKGRLTRVIELPLLIKFEGAGDSRTQSYLLRMDVARVPALDAPEGGVQIVSFFAINKSAQ